VEEGTQEAETLVVELELPQPVARRTRKLKIADRE
jgi:hypothetical protein